MNFQDRSAGSVQSLLAQLRAAQDGADAVGTGSSSRAPATTSTTKTEAQRQRPDERSSRNSVPSSQQLSDLLSSLNRDRSPPTSATTDTNITSAGSAKRKALIEPFGPVAQYAPAPASASPVLASRTAPEGKGKDDPGYATMPFTQALPIISQLLSDPSFRHEVKRMKVDQDTLERRLWAKSEKVKSEHEKTTRTDKEIARITGKPISPTKEREWRAQLSDHLQDFHRQHCLPVIDSLATRHRERLLQLGVPGLGGDMGDIKARERVRRIMDVLEGSLDDL